jgi:phosphatidylglycerophosphatase A
LKLPPFSPLKMFVSFFFTGYFPKAPGTFASLMTIPLILIFRYFVMTSYGKIIFIIGLIFFIIISCQITEFFQKLYKVHDPSYIVIDEVIGMLVGWSFYFPQRPTEIFLLFVFFRFFDIVKVWPANRIDQRMTHGAGTILDDVVSGLYAGGLLYLCTFFLLPYFGFSIFQ